VALGLELLDGDVAERAIERARFGMSEDKQDFHGSAILKLGEPTHQLANAGTIRYM